MGVPAKVVKEATPEQKEGIRRNADRYIALAKSYQHG
jgi:carbonic anhydrase/acetyltransferase-like protein (isoleucine patch superfamily)